MLIALDLDGTLTNSEKVITPLTLKALKKAQLLGHTIVLASGRPTYGIAPLADQLGLQTEGGYILSYNGGKIVDWRTKEELYSNTLPPEAVPLLIDYSRRNHYTLLGYVGQEIVSELPDNPYAREESRINRMPLRRVDNLAESLAPRSVKLLLAGEPALMEKAEKEIAALVGDHVEAYRSAPFFVEIVPKGIDKAQSLQRLLSHLGLTTNSLVSFGDGYNDLSMLRLSAYGVVMANAAPEVREAAAFVTLSNDNDGIAHFLEQHNYFVG